MAWNPPSLSVLTKIDASGALVQLVISLSRELERIQEEITVLKKQVGSK